MNTNEKIALISAALTLITLMLTIFNYYSFFSPGTAELLPLSGYCIMNGTLEPKFPSYQLVLPLEWRNSGGTASVIRDLTLFCHEKETGKDYIFPLAGEYPEMSNEAFNQRYIVENSFVLPPHSISQRDLLFHIKNWWNTTDHDAYNFKFTSYKNLSIIVAFKKDNDSSDTTLPTRLNIPTYRWVDELNGTWRWDFSYL